MLGAKPAYALNPPTYDRILVWAIFQTHGLWHEARNRPNIRGMANIHKMAPASNGFVCPALARMRLTGVDLITPKTRDCHGTPRRVRFDMIRLHID